jgi:DNA-binding LacI/PurR family transcriptional regulator
MLPVTERSRHVPRLDAGQVLQVLDDFCRGLQPGDLVPSHVELMRRFDASERSVRWALDELRRQGKIVRRRGARTCVAELPVSQHNEIVAPAPEARAVNSRTIVAIATPDHAMFDQAMKLLMEQAQAAGLSIFCHLVPAPACADTPLPPLSQEPLGFIVFRGDALPLAERLQAEGHRVILVGTPRADATPTVPLINSDHDLGGYLACKHLIELGHRRIAYCAGPDIIATFRWQGHERAIVEAHRQGLDIQSTLIHLDDIKSWKADPAPGEAIFRGPEAPTALAVWNDHEAVMVMAQLNRYGLRVPEDVSIVGYDNLPEGRIMHPALTTVDTSIEYQLQAAIGLLSRPKLPDGPYRSVTLPVLIPRESSASVPFTSPSGKPRVS